MKKQKATKWIKICLQLSLDMKLGLVSIAYNVRGLLLWGIVAVSARLQNPIKETNYYLKRKADN